MITAQQRRQATTHLWTFLISKLVSSFGSQVYTFGISFYILSMTGSAMTFALNLVSSVLPRTLLSPFAGLLADRVSKKTIVISAQIVSALAVVGLIWINAVQGLSLPAIYATTAILSIASTFSSVTFTSSIANLIDSERIQKAMSFNQMSASVAAIGGPAVGGLLFGFTSMTTFLMIHVVSYVIATILESTMNFKLFTNKEEVESDLPKKKESTWEGLKGGFAYLNKQPVLRVIIWTALMVNFFFGALNVGFSYVLVDQLKVASQHFGLAEAAFAMGMLATSIYFSIRKEFNRPLLIAKRGISILGVGLAAIGIPLFLTLPYTGIVSFYMVLMFVNGICIIFINTPTGVYLQKNIEEKYRGRVFGLIESVASALVPLSMILFGWLFDIVPAAWILLVCAVLTIAVVQWMMRPSILRMANEIPETEPTVSTKEVETVA